MRHEHCAALIFQHLHKRSLIREYTTERIRISSDIRIKIKESAEIVEEMYKIHAEEKKRLKSLQVRQFPFVISRKSPATKNFKPWHTRNKSWTCAIRKLMNVRGKRDMRRVKFQYLFRA